MSELNVRIAEPGTAALLAEAAADLAHQPLPDGAPADRRSSGTGIRADNVGTWDVLV